MLSGAAPALIVIAIIAQLILPAHLKPAHLIGDFGGSTEKAEIEAKQATAVEYARQQAAATAYAQALAQMEAEVSRKQQEVIGDTFGVKNFFAQMADLGCMVGSVIPPNAMDKDTKNMGQALRSVCGVSDQIRSDIINTQGQAGRNGSSIIQRPSPLPRRVTP